MNEDTFWFYPSVPIRYGLNRVSLYGTLEGVENINPGRNLKVTPFVTAGIVQHLAAGGSTGSFSTDQQYDGGADAYFQFYDRLSIDSHLLQSDTPGRLGQDQARQVEVAWRKEQLTVAAGYNELQTNFNPEVGFVRRGSNTRYDGTFSWNPRIDSSEAIRNLVFGTSLEYYEDEQTRQIETRTRRLNVGIAFENNGSIVKVTNLLDF